MNIYHLRHKEIDRKKWDNTIEQSFNSLPYAFSWYLDIVSPGWEALVSDDYQTVMPLPRKTKLGISYLIQPYLTQQLGIFSQDFITSNVIESFISSIPYHAYELRLNYANACTFEAYTNYTLSLNKPYERIAAGYHKNTIRNLEKAKADSVQVRKVSFDDYFNFWKNINRNKYLPTHKILNRIGLDSKSRNTGQSYAAFTGDGEMIAAVFLLSSSKRIVYLTPASSPKGFEMSAMFLIIDTVLREHAESDRVFDFEGSRIAGIARFYAGFGAEDHPYFVIRKNRPQWLIKLLHP